VREKALSSAIRIFIPWSPAEAARKIRIMLQYGGSTVADSCKSPVAVQWFSPSSVQTKTHRQKEFADALQTVCAD
jgi:hypothetical protein